MTTMQPSRPSKLTAGAATPSRVITPITTGVDPFRVLRKHLSLVCASAVFGILFGVALWLVLLFVYPLYTSKVIFEIRPALDSSSQVIVGDLEKDDVVVRFARTEMSYVLNRAVLAHALANPSVQNETVWARGFRGGSGEFLIEDAIDELEDDLVVRYVPDTNLWELEWSTHEKGDVAVVLNTLGASYLRLRSDLEDSRFETDLMLFQNQQAELNRQLGSLNAEMARFVEQYSVFTLEMIHTHPLMAEVAGMNGTITQARSQVAIWQTQYDQIAAKLVGELDPSPEDRLLAEQDRNVYALIQQITGMQIQRNSAAEQFGPEHNSVKDVERMLRLAEDAKERLTREIMNRNLNAQLKSLTNNIDSYNQLIEELKLELAEKDQQLKVLAGRVSEYESLVQRREQLLGQLQVSQEVVTELQQTRARSAADRVQKFADAMTPRERSFPLPEIMIPLGFLLVVGLTIGLIFLRELTDTRVKSASDLAIVPGARVLGVVPDLQEDPTRINRAELAVRDEPRSVIAESYRQTCTPILKAMDRSGHQSILVVGGLPGSGSTTVVSNLAAFIAAGGKRVLAIDANFRRPALAAAMGSSKTEGQGLGDVLAGAAKPADVIVHCGTGIDVMLAGTPSHRVFERLSNGQFEVVMADVRARYDYVIVDAPPAVVAGDAMVLANKVDAAVLVVRAAQEQRGLVARLISQFGDAQCELLGVILNRPRWTAGGYFKKNFATMAAYATKSNA